jgi:HNH endonuclease
MPKRTRPLAERFWEKVDKDGPIPDHRPDLGQCWVWTGSISQDRGYISEPGKRNRSRLAYRMSWELAFGPIPPGQWICHRCDNPPCVRPSHLFAGSRAANITDMVAKQRQARGQMKRSAKLTAEAAKAIKESQEPRPVLAARYGVSPQTISDIRHGRGWKHV